MTLLKDGLLLDNSGTLVQSDILIAGDTVADIRSGIEEPNAAVVNASGKLVIPGMVDLHVHLREPGYSHKETIYSGTRAAAKGGFTTIAAMPNTDPVLDSVENLEQLQALLERDACIRVLPYACITRGSRGEEVVSFSSLTRKGVLGFTDDGNGVQDSRVMLEAMECCADLGMMVSAHCEDNSLSGSGLFHAGAWARKHGVAGIPAVSESTQLARDMVLAKETGVHYHVCHVSAAQSVRIIELAKAEGVRVTAEVTPHHLLLCVDDIPAPDANYKMNPPLRSLEDKAALIAGVKNGIIDFVATDHAPHTAEEKGRGVERAPFGVVGLETAFPLLYTHLVRTGILTLKQLVDAFTVAPCGAFGLPYGRLEPGGPADITVVDLESEKAIEPGTFLSKGKNTPFAGWRCKGWPVLTMFAGRVVWQDERSRP